MISIIIPTKNEEKYLPKLLNSIKIQGIENLEIIVADANSTDKTREIAKKYGCKVVSGGLPAIGRNNGAKHSKGELLIFIDADIILPKKFLKNALKEFNKKRLDIAGTLQKPLKNPKRLKNVKYNLIYESSNNFMRFTQKSKNPFMQVCMLIKKDVHERTGGFNEELIFGEDSEYAKRASKKGNFGILDCDKIFISPRRFEREGLRVILKNVYFIGKRFLGYEITNKSKIKYFTTNGITKKSLEQHRTGMV